MTPPIAQRLREAAASLPDDRVPMESMMRAHGPEAHGTVLMLLAAPCLLPVPGVGTVLGLGIAALAVTLWSGKAEPSLPRRVANLQLSRHWAQRVLLTLASVYALAGRCAKARLDLLAYASWRFASALAVGAMGFIVLLPIPFGNVLPAIALMLIGMGLVFRDGVAMILGLLMAAVALAATIGLVLLAGAFGGEWLLSWA